MSKPTGAALDRAVANAMGLKSVNNCEKWRNSMDDEDDDIQDYKKPWVGLTEDEMSMIGYAVNGDEFEAMRLAEAKLKEKNNGL